MAACSSGIAAPITAPSDKPSKNSIAAAPRRSPSCWRFILAAATRPKRRSITRSWPAEKSQRRWANSEALTYFNDALRRLDLLPDTEANRLRRIDAVLKQAEVKFALGQHAEHIQALDRIAVLVDEIDDPRRLATWHYWRGWSHILTVGQPDIAIDHCNKAAAFASAAGLDEVRAFAESCLAQVYLTAGRLREAIEAGERALASFEALGNLWWAVRTISHLSPAAIALGEWDRSLKYCRRAIEYGIDAQGGPA